MVHARSGAAALEEVFTAGGILAVEPGLPHVRFFERRYDPSRMKVVPNTYSIAPSSPPTTSRSRSSSPPSPISARR